MMALAGGIRRQAESIRDWIVKEILRQQKPELDRKIDEMLKPPKRVIQKYLGLGKSIGRRVTGSGLGRSISRKIRTLRIF